MTPTRQTWAVIDAASDPGVVLGAARLLSAEVVALVIGPRTVAEHVSTFGPSETRWQGTPPDAVGTEDYAPAIADLAREEMPVAVVMASSVRTRLLADGSPPGSTRRR